jgi:hypothetical protein
MGDLVAPVRPLSITGEKFGYRNLACHDLAASRELAETYARSAVTAIRDAAGWNFHLKKRGGRGYKSKVSCTSTSALAPVHCV